MAGKDKEVVQTGTTVVDNSKDRPGRQPDESVEKPTADSQSKKQETGDQDSKGQDSQTQDKQAADTKASDAKAGDQQAVAGKEGDQSKEDLAAYFQKLQESNTKLAEKLDGIQTQQNNQDASGQDQTQPLDQINTQLQDLRQQVTDGDIDMQTYVDKQSELLEQKQSILVDQRLDQYNQEQEAMRTYERYLQENPDFREVVASQDVQGMIQQNPILDEVSGYERAKRMAAEAKVQELEQRMAALEKEQQEAVRNGDRVTDTPGKESGTDLKDAQAADKNLSPREGMLAALRKHRAAQA